MLAARTLTPPSTSVRLLSLAGLALISLASFAAAPDVQWQHLSSKTGQLPTPPGGSVQQTGAVVADFDGDGVNDFVLSFRQKAPALVWYRRTPTGWDPFVIDKDYLTIEAGGAVCDIDGDGDLDLVFGGDWQSPQVWWWENPAPNFDKNRPWKRHLIKQDGQNQHHDQAFGDRANTRRLSSRPAMPSGRLNGSNAPAIPKTQRIGSATTCSTATSSTVTVCSLAM